ncbi:MAG TPA: hypothetical protein VMS11_10665 [Solirubrobacterales bacterium]|nr:hypothetical protein [Solirubrobacterales bacterium]
MNHARNRSRARLGGLLALALGVAALLAIPMVSAARQGADDGPNHEANHENGHHNGNHHGRHHHRTVVGTIASFDADSGLLTIDLRRGGSVSGIVNSRTKIKCEDQEIERHHSRGDDRRGRSGEAEPGDDHGGGGEAEPGDDHGGGDNSGPGSSGSGHDDNGSGANCTAAALVAGADVQEADLEIEHGTRHFDEVELAH